MDSVEAETIIQADPNTLYDLVSDLPGMGRFSPENTGGKWTSGSGPSIGAKFRGSNKDGWRRWSTLCTVTTAEPGRSFAFEVSFAGMKVARWTYTFEQRDSGTRVVERWDDLRPSIVHGFSAVVMGVPDRPGHNRDGMEQTLANLKAYAEK